MAGEIAAPKRPAWWPSAREEALARLALGVASDSTEARQALERAAADPTAEEARLLPLLYRRLRLAPDPSSAVGSGLLSPEVETRLRHAWITSRALRARALRQTGEVLGILASQGVAAAPLKGLALDLWYGDSGRPIGDIDLLIPVAEASRAIRCLESEGYAARDAADPESARAKHSCALGREGDAEVDLHWLLDARFATGSGMERAMARYWREAREVTWQGRTVHRLRDEHHFLHCLVHGARVDSRAQARWAVDAFAILCREPDAFSWDEVFAAADEARLRPWLEPALAWLDHLRPGIGEVAPSHGSSAAVEGRDRFLWWLDSHALRPGVGLDLQRTLRTHLARSRDRGLLAGLSSYPGFLLESGLVTSPRQVLRHLRRRRRERRAASRIAST